MLYEKRVTYENLKQWALETYYEGCRDHAVIKGWPHEQIIGYVSHQFENVFQRPIEQTMWHVILLVLSGGWHKDILTYEQEIVRDALDKYGLENLLADVPTDEAEEFRHDLRILKLI